LNIEKSLQYTKEFDEVYPIAHSNFRARIAATDYKMFVKGAKGSRIFDVDGNEYVDFLGAFGPTILGHAHPDYIAALKDHLDNQATIYSSGILFTPEDIELANKIIKHIPCAEMVKLSVSGTEAVQTAIRLARAYTGKTVVIRFAEHYHGWIDNVLGGLLKEGEGKPYPDEDPNRDIVYTPGRSPWAVNETFLLPWNDFEALESTVEKYHDEIAMIHFEGIVCNHFCLYPKPGFLEKIRELCDEYNIVMSMDEVITGFRLGMGGAQAYLGVTPDICTFGKAISNGLPFSAVAGCQRVMETFKTKKILGPGTYNGYALGVKAALATLSILERDDCAGYKAIVPLQEQLVVGLLALAKEHGIAMTVNQAPGVFYTVFGVQDTGKPLYTEEDLADFDQELSLKFWRAMVDEGVLLLMACKWYMCTAHKQADVDYALAAADRAMAKIK
jgi:glutamate-1-semialdehyde 2,1-aminomutase